MLEVAEHYYHFGGKSPINEQNRQLVAAVERELSAHGHRLKVYWGNRNWHPLLADTLRQMAADGVRRALAFVTSAFGSYSGCRQYREDIERARQAVGPLAPEVDKLRVFFNHPGFIEPMIEHTRQALESVPSGDRPARLLFTAHSIPLSMAATSRYQEQLGEACRLVAEGVGRSDWALAYQSRSGPPHQPWLEPDISELVRQAATEAPTHGDGKAAPATLVVVPIGFLSDHMEVLYDLDFELRALCESLGVRMVRASTVGVHPRFVRMVRELVEERTQAASPRLSLGSLGASPDECPVNCCEYRAPPRSEDARKAGEADAVS
jgi:ferrochelatase